MSEENGSNSFLGFIVGALLVVVLVVGFIAVRGGGLGSLTGGHTATVKIQAPEIGKSG